VTKLSKIFDIYTKQAELIFEKTDLLLQKDDAFRNLGETGYQVENFVRETLRQLLPSRFRLTSGYIVNRAIIDNDEDVPQCDLIIADAFIPSLYKIDGDIEVVPVEAVCGVIEIKRSLFNSSGTQPLEKAIEHLVKIGRVCQLTKTDNEQVLPLIDLSPDPNNAIRTGKRNNPLIGVISLALGGEESKRPEKSTQAINLIHTHESRCDFIYSFDGFSLMTQKEGAIFVNSRRDSDDPWPLGVDGGKWNWNDVSQGKSSRSQIFARAIGFISSYLSLQAGKPIDVNDYFFNTKIFEQIK
jgi:hypothetical protein